MRTRFAAALFGSTVSRGLPRAIRCSIGAAVVACLVGPASAMTVVYNWVPDPGQGGSGSLTISDPNITDPANFGVLAVPAGPSVPTSALIGLNFTWNNGANITLASVVTNSAPSWSACQGYLITGFQITANSSNGHSGTYSLANSQGSCFSFTPFVLPGPASNGTNSVFYGAESQAGHWQLGSPVPIPAAAWLLGSALAALAGVRRRRFA
jgi:hypothetical protein